MYCTSHTVPLFSRISSSVMATQGEIPAPQPQQAESAPRPTLQQGYIQGYECYLKRKSKYLKRWKKEWLKVVPGEEYIVCVLTLPDTIHMHV